MSQMNEATLLSELDNLTNDATGNNSTFISENEHLLERYLGMPYGDEKPERSSVISQDVMDIVEADMPSLARIFLGPGEILKFKPITAKDEDRQEAEDKTKYVNWQIREQPWSFSVLHGFIKNAEIQKASVVKYLIDERTEVEEHKKTGISDEELAVFQKTLEGKDVKSIEIVREEVDEDAGDEGENTVVIKVERTTKNVRIVDVPLESFRMSKNATDKDDAELVGDESLMSRGSLLAMGFGRDEISQIPLAGSSAEQENTRLKDIRDEQEGGAEDESVASDWASEEVLVQDLYPKIDFDGDGIQERRHILRAGDIILKNEVFNHVPYAIMSSILMPHKTIGRSRAEITAPTALVKTSILRGVQDNIYAVNNPRMGANKNVNMDDLLVMRPNGVVRTTSSTPVGNDLLPIVVPYIGAQALQVVQYWDQARAQSTGSLLASQGLNADDLGKETATRFTGIEDASGAKVELVARVMAETGFRQLFEGVAWLDANFQNSKIEIEILGQELSVNPADWQFKHHVVSKVGLGAGDDEKILQTLSALWALHQQLQAKGSPMTDEVKRYNVLKGMVTASGLPEIAEFFNDPEQPEALTLAQNEIMTNLVQQLQEQLQAVQNPLAEAEQIKARATLVKAQATQQLDIAKLAEDQRQFNIQTAQKQDQFMKDLAAELTRMGLQFGAKVEGAIES